MAAPVRTITCSIRSRSIVRWSRWHTQILGPSMTLYPIALYAWQDSPKEYHVQELIPGSATNIQYRSIACAYVPHVYVSMLSDCSKPPFSKFSIVLNALDL